MKEYFKVLTIAGSDSGGGAGVNADIKAVSACGCYAASVITAVTVQNTLGVKAVHDVPPEIISGQIHAVLDDIGTDSVKIGMLSKKETVLAVAMSLKNYDIKNIVLDPVMVSTSGHSLLKEDAVETIMKELFPLVRIITPNIPEAEMLLGEKISDQKDTEKFAEKLSKIAGNSVLLKAGHFSDKILSDVFYNAETGQITRFDNERVVTENSHGTGCTLSSALAAFLAKGLSMECAVENAENYLHNALKEGAAYKLGGGHGPVKHFWRFW
ncbi:MAG: bifunctional hydroxymethylpyrimidine kinase/phosphomethylpyrimidine kinase [Bacteroidales bacterium]|nr:bifunctional hydroxymethylpyrimidine kinase/phosphomethylpyrimidine kinase [Bacteroidales bacterium]